MIKTTFRFIVYFLAASVSITSCKKSDPQPIDNLVCYLPMNGNAKDASHYANATQVEGATLTTGRNSLANSAYLLNGLSNDIVISTSDALDAIQKITLSAWIKPVSFAGVGNNAIIEKAYYAHFNPYYQYKLGITGDQHPNLPGSFIFSLSLNGSYQNVATSAGTWTPGSWYFVAATYDGSNMILYVNGIQVATKPMTGKIDNWGTDIYLGKVNNADEYTPGTLGDIRIYNRALSAQEVGALYLK